MLITLMCLALLSIPSVGTTADANPHRHAWDQLRQGRAVAIMRHALAPGFSDPEGFELEDCRTQRNLNAEGQAQSRAIGQLFAERGIERAQVFSSQWCRCLETARLMGLGEVMELPALNSFFEDRSSEPQQTQSLRRELSGWLDGDFLPTVLVTHQVNISALTNAYTQSGEILIITLNGDSLEILASISTLP